MPARPDFLTNSMIIGAHPDDEMLWFNAIVGKVDKVVIVFRDFWAAPRLGPARAAAMAALPLRDVTCLNIAEPGSYGCADWQNPVLTDYGMRLGPEETRREVTRLAKRALGKVSPLSPVTSPERVDQTYRDNFTRICDALAPMLTPDMNVFTHNPWGEYGHEDHVQIFRALDHLRRRIGFTLWMSNYCTERSLPLAMRYLRSDPAPYVRLPTDKALAEAIADVYRAHDCWTWTDDWAWFDDECYIEAPRGEAGGNQNRLMPLNFFSGETAPRKPLPLKTSSALILSALAGAALADLW